MDVVIDCNFRQQVRMGERRPEKAGGGSIPSLATKNINRLQRFQKPVSFRFIPRTLVC